jgi:hypothetical protein
VVRTTAGCVARASDMEHGLVAARGRPSAAGAHFDLATQTERLERLYDTVAGR